MYIRTSQTGTTTDIVNFRPCPADAESTTKRVDSLASEPTVLTVCEVAKVLRLGKISVYQAIEKGEIPCIRIGRRILIPRHALERLLENLGPIPKPAV